jgi:hypothetical protein
LCSDIQKQSNSEPSSQFTNQSNLAKQPTQNSFPQKIALLLAFLNSFFFTLHFHSIVLKSGTYKYNWIGKNMVTVVHYMGFIFFGVILDFE